MLLKTTAEVKQLMPKLLAKMNNNALLPNMDRPAQKYLLPLLGQTFLDQLVTAYTNNSAAGPIVIILKNAQLVVASHAFLDDIGSNVATITDAGLASHQTANMPRVYGWEFKSIKQYLQNIAADAVDVLLQSLWINKSHAALASWVASDAFKQFSSLLIRTAFEFNEAHRLFQPQRTFYAIKTYIQDCQEQIICQAIGESLVEYFISAALSDDEKKVMAHLQKALAFYTIKKSCEHNSVRVDEYGFTIMTGGDPESDDAGRSGNQAGFILQKMQACERDGKAYLSKAKKELIHYSKQPDVPAGFTTAFLDSPLKDVDPDAKRDLGNAHRKGIFRM